MNDLRTAAQQALDSINELFAAEQSEGGERGGHIRTPATREHLVRVAQARKALHESCGALQAALAQKAEPRNQCGETCERAKLCATCAQVLAQQAEGGGNLPPPLQAEPTGKQPLQVESVAAVAEIATTQQRDVETPPSDYRRGYWDGFNIGKREGRIEAEDAAKQAEPVQPVAWRYKPMIGSSWSLSDDGYYVSCKRDKGYIVDSLYTAPPQRKPLTEEEIESCRQQGFAHAGLGAPFDFGKAARAVEKASWEKNHG